jgi:RNA polymerase sigma factor (sigma-70 family)
MSSKAHEVAFDRTLVDRFKNGDQSAFDEMVSRYWDRIYSMVHQLLRNQQDAEEVTQDAFIRAHRGLANFRGDSAFSTWLYQIATNLARNRYWYWWRRKRDKSVSFDAPVSSENDMTLADIIPAEVESPGRYYRESGVREPHRPGDGKTVHQTPGDSRAAQYQEPVLRGNRRHSRHFRGHREKPHCPRARKPALETRRRLQPIGSTVGCREPAASWRQNSRTFLPRSRSRLRVHRLRMASRSTENRLGGPNGYWAPVDWLL